MKHSEMIPLMGKRVVVTSILQRVTVSHPKVKWIPIKCPDWVGWIVGFRYKQDGIYSHPDMETTLFTETRRQLCVLITEHPTKLPKYVPLDGYKLPE